MMHHFWKERVAPWFKFHVWGIIVSLAICLVVSLPPVIFHYSPHYQGVDMLKTNTEEHYVSQVQEVYDGHSTLGNPYLSDLKETPYLFPTFGPNLIAAIGKLLFLNAVQAILVERFFFSFAIAFVLYLFAFAVSKRRQIAVLTPAAIMLAYNLLDPGVIPQLLTGYVHFPRVGFIGYGRPVNPEVSFLIFGVYMLAMWRFVEEKKSYWYGILASLLLGLSFYAYLYTWTFIFTLNGCLAFIFAIKREWKKVKQLAVISLGGALLGIPYFLHLRTIMAHPWYAETAPRFGFVPSREPNLSRVVFSAVTAFLVSWKLFTRTQRRFWIAFFLAAIIVVNEQIVTGKYIFNHHFHWYYNTPLVILFLVSWLCLVQERFLRYRQLRYVLAGLLLLGCFANGILRQREAYIVALPQVIDEQRYAPVFAWFNTQTAKDSTALGNYAVYNMINSVTHSNAYYSPSAIVTLTPTIRFIDNFIAYTYLDYGPSTTIGNYFEANRKQISNSVFDYQYHFTQGKCLECFPDEVITYMTETYQSLNKENFMPYIKKYPIDYLVWDTVKDPNWRIDQYELPVAARFTDFIIYDLRSPTSSQ